MEFSLSDGFGPQDRGAVARLYWQAFGHKLGRVMGPDARALAFLERVADPRFAIVARDADGTVRGVAGYKTDAGALIGGGYGDLVAVYGHFGALWRAAILSMIERPLSRDVLLMDGICVDAAARGAGLGSSLLDAIKARAQELGKDAVRLDVIDINPRARALYDRHGFVATRTETLGPFRYVFRFNAATQMIWRADAE